jgi:hypothetical protein
MRLAEQWTVIEKGLDPRWADARLVLTIDDASRRQRAAALLGPASPGVGGNSLSFHAGRDGRGVGPEAVRRLLRRLDDEGIQGALDVVSTGEAPVEPVASRASLAAAWDAALASLPADWSDLLCEIELTSSDHIDHAALLMAPLNPIQGAGSPRFRFRCAQTFGYGAAPGMVRRCLARADEQGIPGGVRVVRVLSDTQPVATQGPVWNIGGKAV